MSGMKFILSDATSLLPDNLSIIIIVVVIIIIVIISFFKVDLYITFYNYKKPINVNLPRKLEKNSDTKCFANSLM